jgi:chromosome segregation ATPase
VASNAGQSIAIITAITTAISLSAGYLQSKYGKRIDRLGTAETRQSAIEENLRQQCVECNHRLDEAFREKASLEERARLQLETGARERRELERDYREEIRKLEEEIETLRQKNADYRNELWLYKHQAIGFTEPKRVSAEDLPVPPPEKSYDEHGI